MSVWMYCPAHRAEIGSVEHKQFLNDDQVRIKSGYTQYLFRCGCEFRCEDVPAPISDMHLVQEWKAADEMKPWEYAKHAFGLNFTIPTKGHHLWKSLGQLLRLRAAGDYAYPDPNGEVVTLP